MPSPKKKITPEDMVALSKLMVGVSGLLTWLEGKQKAGDKETLKKAEPVQNSARSLLRVFKPLIAETISELAWIADQPSGKRLAPALKRARMGGSPEMKAVRQSKFIAEAFKVASIRQEMRSTLFGSGKAAQQARQIGTTIGEGPVELVTAMVKLPPVGKGRPMTATKKWLKEVAKLMEVDGSSEERMADIGEAQSIATEIKEIDRILRVTPTSSETAKSLQASRSKKMDTLMKVAQSTGDEQAALGAASTIIYGNHTHATEIGKKLGLTEEQEDALMVTGKSLIAAGAGSGKTRVLAGKVVDIINREGGKSSQIIATSFSKKSAAELKERVKKYGGSTILDGGDGGFGTTHRIGKRLLQKLNPKYKGADTLEGNYLMKMAMKQVEMLDSFQQPPSPVGMFDGLYGSNAKDVDLTADEIPAGGATTEEDITLRRVIDQIYGLAKWGVGKGADWAIKEKRLLEPLMQRLDSLTLDSLSAAEKALINQLLSIKRYQNSLSRSKFNLDPNYKVANRGYRKTSINYFNEPAGQWFNIGGVFMDEEENAIGVKRVALAVGKLRSDLKTPSEAWAEANTDKEYLMAACYGAYMWLKENEPNSVGKIDFTDMQLETIKELIKNPKALAAVQKQYKWVLVDEAQDLNKLQHLLFGLIAGAVDPKTRKEKADGSMTANTFTFIGDDKQAIYEFRGATPEEYSEKSHMRGGSFDTKLISSNFRSGKNIVDAANKLIAHNERQIPMVCSTSPSRGEGEINFQVVEDHDEGAALCAEEIKGLIDSEGWTEPDIPSFGVAVRTNAEAMAFGLEMIKRRIPFRSKMNFFTDPTTQAITAWLALAEADADDKKRINDAVLKAHSSPRFYLNTKFSWNLQKKARGQNYLEWLRNGGWNRVYEGKSAWMNRRVKLYTDTLVRVQNLTGSPREILEAVMQIKGAGFKDVEPESIIESLINTTKGSPEAMDLLYEESADGTVSEQDIKNMALAPIAPLTKLLNEFEDLGPAMDYVRELQNVSTKKSYIDDPEKDPDAGKPAVTIDTCHGWKGLEARHMWVPMAAGVFPHVKSEGDPEAMASERRLAYVALTRGRDSVNVLCPMESHIGRSAGPSQFVSEACIRNREDDSGSESEVNRTASEIAERDAEIWNYIRTSSDGDLTDEEWREFDLFNEYGDQVFGLGT